jgi:hypothetical protein
MSPLSGGYTTAGSNLRTHYENQGSYGYNGMPFIDEATSGTSTSASLSGTWRLMSPKVSQINFGVGYHTALWVRIS